MFAKRFIYIVSLRIRVNVRISLDYFFLITNSLKILLREVRIEVKKRSLNSNSFYSLNTIIPVCHLYYERDENSNIQRFLH